jgi:glycosyltransferase involved in cell wall biosynthesis
MTLLSRLVFFPKKKTLISSGRILTNEISLVVPVKDNQEGVDHYLDTLFQILKPGELPLEIIIVDNNSNPAFELPFRFNNKGLRISVLSCSIPGPAAARNYGVKNASGEWILFNDSDCLPTKSLISGYMIAENGSVAYAGNIKSFGNDRLSQYYESQEILLPLKTINHNNQHVPQYLITANTLVWRDAFISINGFNENIPIAGGEDVDLGLRLSEIGNLCYAYESIALHKFDDGIPGFCKRFIRYGQGNRMVEELWKTRMKPRPFRPNESTLLNEFFAKLQFLLLLYGYYKPIKKRKKTMFKTNSRQANHQADIKNRNVISPYQKEKEAKKR